VLLSGIQLFYLIV